MEPAQIPAALRAANLDQLPVVKVSRSSLFAADSPRRAGENLVHARMLAESEDQLPPIVVHRSTMRVIDGMHRLHAAELRGDDEIEVRFFDGDEASSFVLAVRANVMHGLPLSLADRKAAASRIMDLYPQWSDRMVASVTGLAAKTVAAARERPSGGRQQLDSRVGRDGRIRPVNGAERRQIAAQVMADNPDASLREVARRAGISPETVRDIRARLIRGDESCSARRQNDARAGQSTRQPACSRAPVPDGTLALQALRADPAFRSTESGRSLLWMLNSYCILRDHGRQLIDSVPAHSMSRVAEAVLACARGWQDFAELVEQQRQVLSKEEP